MRIRSVDRRRLAAAGGVVAALLCLLTAGAWTSRWLAQIGAPPAPAAQGQQMSAPVASPTDEPTAQPGTTANPAATTPQPPRRTGITYYVSRRGHDGDGRSWDKAWSNLDRIDWEVIQPGDTILIDGGETQMVYDSALTVLASGTKDAPITIRLADEPGRSGQAVIFGGRATPLPYCGQKDYANDAGEVRKVGLEIGDAAWIVVDGGKWRGIAIHGHSHYGVHLDSRAADIVVRHLEVFDNGSATRRNGRWYPGQEGIGLAGTNIVFERVIVHNNGEDAFQSSGGLRNFTLRNSWLYNERKDPQRKVWNYCQHPDGLQVFAGGEQRGVTVEGSVIGPGWMQGLMLGNPFHGGERAFATVHDVTVRNSLLYGAGNANIADNAEPSVPSTNWRIANVTSDRPSGAPWHNVSFSGKPSELTISDSIFTGGNALAVPPSGAYAGNVQFDVGGTRVGATVDPQYADPAAYGSDSPTADFSLAPGSPAAGRGSPITSAAGLLHQPSPLPSPTPAAVAR